MDRYLPGKDLVALLMLGGAVVGSLAWSYGLADILDLWLQQHLFWWCGHHCMALLSPFYLVLMMAITLGMAMLALLAFLALLIGVAEALEALNHTDGL